MQNGYRAVPHIPAKSVCQRIAHDIGTERSADSPHTVEPAHMFAGIVERNIVVQRSVHTSGTKTIGNSPQAQCKIGMTDGESKQCNGSHEYADGRNLSCSEAFGQSVALQTGNDRP